MIEQTKIEEIVNRIVEKVKPEKIILFGSYARGNPTKHSDLDLCVVVTEKEYSRDLSVQIRRLLRGILVPMDIIVYTSFEIKEWENVKMAFPTTIMRTGKVLYGKN